MGRESSQRDRLLWGGLCIVGMSITAIANATRIADPLRLERNARNALADKLLNLSSSLDMRERSYRDSGGNGGKSFDDNTGNSFLSNTTIHYRVRATCLEWVSNPSSCQRWLDPFIPEHGFGPDFSPLEGTVAQEWQRRQGIDDGTTYGIWQVRRLGGGSNVDYEGKFDKSGISSWRLLPDVERRIAQVGRDTATRQMLATYDRNSGQGTDIMPNLEGLYMMGSRWTKMMRNRLVSNLGEMRASREGVDYLLAEELPDCEAYMAAARQEATTNIFFQEKLTVQAQLRPEAQATPLEDRYQQCVALRNASVRMVNPQVAGGQVEPGDPEGEPIDEALTRLNIAAIDRAGVDVASLPRPSIVELDVTQVTSEIADFNVGGTTLRGMKRQTNARTLAEYNLNLEAAAVGYEAAALRSPNIINRAEQVRAFKIAPESKNLVEINGMTQEMRRELRNTGFAESDEMLADAGRGPASNLEDIPAQLTVTRR